MRTQVIDDLQFRGMAALFQIRDILRPRLPILHEARLCRGDTVLDFGCGPGSYSLLAAEIVGPKGRVYALDRQPLAIERVAQTTLRRGLANLYTIQSDCRTGLMCETVDVVLLYDIFHMLEHPQAVLQELHRVLKPGGRLSVNDHHLQGTQIVAGITQAAPFQLVEMGHATYGFVPKKA
ncbi:MAG: class I SAM-dependent methyltransferase [Chloroflexota bacterium]